MAWLYSAEMPGWRARFSPSELGSCEVVAELVDHRGRRRSEPVAFECIAGADRLLHLTAPPFRRDLACRIESR